MKEGADMTGAELIKWIQDNHAEELDVKYTDNVGDIDTVRAVMIHDGYIYLF